MAARVLLHVGTPKTGTSYLQDVLFRNRHRLAAQGIHYPADRFDDHFLASLDLMRLPWGGLEAEAVGRWDCLAKRVREADGTVIVSHEILATANRAEVTRAVESFGDTELHVLISARDLARQIPAEWQENVKHRATLRYARFLRAIQNPDRTGRIASWFWSVQDLPDICHRWAGALPPDRVRLITVPPPGTDHAVLWQRFSAAFELDGLELDLAADRANPSLGVPETALVRRVNRAVCEDLPPADYRPLVRELLAHVTLSQRTSSPRLGLPPGVRPWVGEVSGAWVAELASRGYRVIGDLTDLVGPVDGSEDEYADPDSPAERQVAAAAVDSIKALLVDNARLRGETARLERELRDAGVRLAGERRLRSRVARRLERSSMGRKLVDAYRRMRPGG
jgi:hypothetical protein